MGTDWCTLKIWIQSRDVVGTDQRAGTDQGPGIDLSSTYTCIPPYTTLLYSKTGVCRGVPIFYICSKTKIVDTR